MKNYKSVIEEELSSMYEGGTCSFTVLFDAIYGYHYKKYTQDYIQFDRFVKGQADLYFSKGIESYRKQQDLVLKEELKNIALRDLYRRYDVLVRLEDRSYFDIVLKNATDFLKGETYLYEHGYEYESGQVLYDLAIGLDYLQFREEVVSFFKASFDIVIDHVEATKLDEADATTLLVLAQVISSFAKELREEFAGMVFSMYTYAGDEDRGYSTNQTSGFIALLLPMFNTDFDTRILEKAFEVHWPYHNNVFIHQTLYAKWILQQNGKEALNYLQDEENKKWPTFAIMALADLDYKEALPVLEAMYPREKDPVIFEVYLEAIHRLQTQEGSPSLNERMIALNGNVSPVQRALGTASNNVFVQRAKEKYAVDDTVYETDDY